MQHRQRSGRFAIDPRVRREIYERDGWCCKLCGYPVDPSDPFAPWAPSLDHIVPQSRQLLPDHSSSALRTSHLLCNSVRSDGEWTKELRLKMRARYRAENGRRRGKRTEQAGQAA